MVLTCWTTNRGKDQNSRYPCTLTRLIPPEKIRSLNCIQSPVKNYLTRFTLSSLSGTGSGEDLLCLVRQVLRIFPPHTKTKQTEKEIQTVLVTRLHFRWFAIKFSFCFQPEAEKLHPAVYVFNYKHQSMIAEYYTFRPSFKSNISLPHLGWLLHVSITCMNLTLEETLT